MNIRRASLRQRLVVAFVVLPLFVLDLLLRRVALGVREL